MIAGILAAVVLAAAVVAVVAFKTWWSRKLGLEFLTSDERYHEQALATQPAAFLPQVTLVPDGFTCLGCRENPALPYRVWCAVCTPVSVFTPLAHESIERGQR